MMEGEAVVGAVKETTVFLSYFKDLPDYRQKGKVAYPLEEVLLLMLAAALAGAETVADIARFGQAKLAFLQRFRLFANGTPSHDQLGIILAKLDPVAFQRCFAAWAAALTKTSAEVIAIDGKTVRRSYQKKGAEQPIHVVSAFAARQRIVLGQTRVGDKSNEIVAIPALLELLAIEGAVVTVDAAGCQRKIAQTIIDKKADYILALKGNQGTAHATMSSCSQRSRRRSRSRIHRSARTRPSTATTAASRPGRSPFSTTSAGLRTATSGRA
jgi:predicted transposase YbfD/YdcC